METTKLLPVTAKYLENWLAKYHPNLALWEDRGRKGIYEKKLGPAFSFQVRGRTWREVFLSLK